MAPAEQSHAEVQAAHVEHAQAMWAAGTPLSHVKPQAGDGQVVPAREMHCTLQTQPGRLSLSSALGEYGSRVPKHHEGQEVGPMRLFVELPEGGDADDLVAGIQNAAKSAKLFCKILAATSSGVEAAFSKSELPADPVNEGIKRA